MFFRIVGILWIALGLWWIMRPQAIKRRFSKKVKKGRRAILFSIIIAFSGIFLAAARQAHGALATVLLIVGIIGIIKAVFFLTSKAADRLIDWWSERPLWMWRLWAAGLVVIGLILQKIR